MYKQCDSFQDHSECVIHFQEKCRAIRDASGYSSPDARWMTFNNMSTCCTFGVILLNLLDCLLRSDDDAQRHVLCKIIGVIPDNNYNATVLANNVEKPARLGMATIQQFEIECLLRTIANSIGLNPAGQFGELARNVITSTIDDQNAFATLMVPASIRNSLHNKGLHKHNSFNVQIGDVNFEFTQGELVRCASWAHIAHALEASVDIMATIVAHPKIREITGPIAFAGV